MKNVKLLLLLVLSIVFKLIVAQDVIVLKNGNEIKAKIIKIEKNSITYKEAFKTNGRLYNVNRAEVFMIKYANGEKSVFNNSSQEYSNNSSIEKNANIVTPVEEKKEKEVVPKRTSVNHHDDDPYFRDKRNNYISIASGYGNSYGGIGIRLQWRFGGNFGFGFHLGTGYFPGEYQGIIMVSGGLKMFFYRSLYINTQFGIFGTSHYDYYEYSNGNYYSRSGDDILYGPSVLTGGDWIWGKHFGLNAAGGISLVVDGDYAGTIWPAIDLGFVYKF